MRDLLITEDLLQYLSGCLRIEQTGSALQLHRHTERQIAYYEKTSDGKLIVKFPSLVRDEKASTVNLSPPSANTYSAICKPLASSNTNLPTVAVIVVAFVLVSVNS